MVRAERFSRCILAGSIAPNARMRSVADCGSIVQQSMSAGRRQGSLRLAYFVSHPIQYQSPLLRRLAQEADIDLQVFFSSDHTVHGYVDEGFGVKVTWDVPLLEGYRSEFLPRLREAGNQPGFARPLNRGIFRQMEQGGFDALWTHGYSTANNLQAILAASLHRVPVLLRAESTLHDRPRTRARLLLKETFFRGLRRHVAAVLAIGQANARYWRRYMGEAVPIFHMPYAVDNAFFQRKAMEAASGREALRRELELEPERPVILFASKLQERKRCADLLAAHRMVGNRPSSHRPYLLIVGDGEERQRLEQAAEGDPLVRFLGFRNQTELPRFFDLCDVFVLPSVHEPWGLVVNEAMNAGRAVIASDDVGCQEDLVRDGVNGAVFPACDVPGLARAIERVLASPETAAQMGEHGRRMVAEYSFEQDVRGLRQALATCVPGFIA
jgi:glycosyltransferase involved in cell wall biosynthesis